MCDTILATPGSSAQGAMLFGKNSDRHSNEAQAVEYFARASHAPDAMVKCTYLTIPQAAQTHAVLLCRPFWIWGAEMGANEHGVVIGNEGIHARVPASQDEALTGMDLLRLSLERASTAAEAVEVITTLLRAYGQGGNCGYFEPSYYNNGFMVADANEAYAVETLGREWLIERVSDVRALSNRFSIRFAQRMSDGLATLIKECGWSTEPDPRYADVIADPHREHLGNAEARLACSTALLKAKAPTLSAADMMSILRDHGTGERSYPQWRSDCTTRRTLCMHAGAKDRPGQTVGSMVSELHRAHAVHWVTGTSAPCLSIFKPVLLDAELPPHGPRPDGRFDARTLWWRHERLHRAALRGSGLGNFIESIRSERDALEWEFHMRVREVVDGGDARDRAHVVRDCWRSALAIEDRWYAQLDRSMTTENEPSYIASWDAMNRQAGLTFAGN
jgi:secernin